MKVFKIGLAAALASVVMVQAQSPQEAWHAQPHAAKTKSVAAGDAALLKACAPEIAAMTADARKQGATFKDAELPGIISEMITNWWWAEYATSGIRAEYKNRPRRKEEGEIMYAFTQCAIATIDAWQVGVRDPAQLRAKWKPFPAGAGASGAPAASKPAAAATSKPAAPATNKPAPPATRAPASDYVDPYAGAPVDCVRLNDTPGSFKNVCDFDVYFTYCGVNPAKDSWVAECSSQSYGLLDIGARSVQGAFTRAETIYTFACKSPKTPKDVRFVGGKGLHGTCK